MTFYFRDGLNLVYRVGQKKILPPDTPGLCSLARQSGVISCSLVANDRRAPACVSGGRIFFSVHPVDDNDHLSFVPWPHA
ncbi:hypothetical protein L596_011772 [Steinernema carpocapsae]|uniref:Uncharacterized protein n=1 Tax=Steinernema carpocapsae TaxID=34508 RepID=A0A4U5NVC3_STECR|nr:hypothetical protein L596_011772 [Steinernema carpocapsae]